MLENALIMVAIIMAINIIYVSLSTLRVILTLKGRRYIAAVIGTIEIIIYTLGLGLVLDNLGEIQNLVAYGLGYGIGVISGSIIEEKLALGYTTVNVISSNPDITFTKQLREKGYGVTSWYAYGMDGDRLALQILSPRKYELHLYETIKSIDPKAFIIAYEPKQIHGGFWVKQVKKGKIVRSVEKEKEQSGEVPKEENISSREQ
ncbi:Uncharacterized protein YebE, UPF0316 family [Gracilibacillus ureilyticus]|uniref:UPF0316 protein SAMN04487944_10784 n=2 Tax=Gracilibacillus ureilyticus TaxID=531814 RepID=A0A1H9QSH1_9BACI|nr:DUF2179 domain-containing protein [Gracilibacillus ureilyticus]SER63408.1 Uncharacterized protein YebE, UPF0316 family [Gracilibacillus ureilyticus]